MSLTVAAFYKFVPIDDCASLQASLQALCAELGVGGTILIAREGINGTVSAEANAIARLFDYIRSDTRFADLEPKMSSTSQPPFQRMKVKVKREIVTFGVPDLRPDKLTGIEVEPRDWNDLIAREDVTVVDTRNAYEVAIGSFPRAVDPETDNFRQFATYVENELADAKDKPIAMFCTGGIRCEKASSYLLSLGFREVYQLKGGILKYLEVIPEEDSQWQGECFVFDDRVALTHGVQEGQAARCDACGHPYYPDSAEEQSSCSCPKRAETTEG